jgi:hypothetical protein
VARHIFQACPVWIYTQSNITSIKLTHSYEPVSLDVVGRRQHIVLSTTLGRYRYRFLKCSIMAPSL